MFRLARNAVTAVALALGIAGIAAAAFDGSARAIEPDGPAACAGQSWPEIDPVCLVAADGAPTRSVRVIEMAEERTAPPPMLVRLPPSNREASP